MRLKESKIDICEEVRDTLITEYCLRCADYDADSGCDDHVCLVYACLDTCIDYETWGSSCSPHKAEK